MLSDQQALYSTLFRAGNIVKEKINTNFEIRNKSRLDIVTDIDLRIETFLKNELYKIAHYPFLAEETDSKTSTSEKNLWIIDPIDGTSYLATRQPLFAISVGLKHNDELVLGGMYFPLLDTIFIASKGHGATKNGIPLHIQDPLSLDQSTLNFAFPRGDDFNFHEAHHLFQKIYDKFGRIRSYGSMTYGISNTLDSPSSILIDTFFYPWDIAGGIVIAREAGASIVDINFNPITLNSKSIVLGHPNIVDMLHKELL